MREIIYIASESRVRVSTAGNVSSKTIKKYVDMQKTRG